MQQLASMLFGTVLAAQAGAAPSTNAMQRYEESVSACTNLPDMHMQQCLSELLEPSDAELRRTYEAALSRAQGRAGELRRAQAAWLRFVDAQCEYEKAQFRGGTAFWSTAYICLIRHYAGRIAVLDRTARQ